MWIVELHEVPVAQVNLVVLSGTANDFYGFTELSFPEGIGWAQDLDNPEAPVALEILVDGSAWVCVLANAYRADLRQAGFGAGCHAFTAVLPQGAKVSESVPAKNLPLGPCHAWVFVELQVVNPAPPAGAANKTP